MYARKQVASSQAHAEDFLSKIGALPKKGQVSAIIQGMLQYPGHENVQERGCQVLEGLVDSDDRIKVAAEAGRKCRQPGQSQVCGSGRCSEGRDGPERCHGVDQGMGAKTVVQVEERLGVSVPVCTSLLHLFSLSLNRHSSRRAVTHVMK